MRVAYLIIAHNEIEILNKLISLLDWPGNDIYVLLDSKSNIVNSIERRTLIYSDLVILKPFINISWGGFSLIQSELCLLRNCA